MGHGYRSALSNWLRGRRRPREHKHEEKASSQVPAPLLPPPSMPGYESDDSRAPTWASSDSASEQASGVQLLGAARDRRSVSDSAVIEATQSTMRHMRSFAAVGGASHMSGPRSASMLRRGSWVPSSGQVPASAPVAAAATPVYPQHQHHLDPRQSVRRFHLSRRISRRLSRPHAHHDTAGGVGSLEAVALTPGPSIIFIEC